MSLGAVGANGVLQGGKAPEAEVASAHLGAKDVSPLQLSVVQGTSRNGMLCVCWEGGGGWGGKREGAGSGFIEKGQ